MMLPLVRDAYLSLQPYIPGKPISETERELGISGVIKLASNENPLGPSPKAVQAVIRAAAGLQDYPDGGGYYLKEKISTTLHVSPDMILLGNGSNEIIDLMVRTFVRDHENMIVGDPTFIAYQIAGEAAGVQIKHVPMPNFEYDLKLWLQAIDAKTKLIFLGNPNNPTGTYIRANDLRDFFEKVPESVIVVLDEAYLEYVTASDFEDGLQFVRNRKRTFVLRTFSKCYGLAGLRVGYAIGHAEEIDYLNRGRLPFNVNSLGLVGALAALDDVEHLQKSIAMNTQEREKITQACSAFDLKVTPSQGNFILVHFEQPAMPVYQQLLQLGVIVRPMGGYHLPQSLRITVGTTDQNQRLLTALAKVLGRSI